MERKMQQQQNGILNDVMFTFTLLHLPFIKDKITSKPLQKLTK